MVLRIFDSGSGRKEVFRPLNAKKVSMYVCGVTPYDVTHLGHAFTYISFDALARYLRYKGFSVVYTQNVTNIDDDILRKSKEEGRDWKEFGDFWTKKYLQDMKNINVQMPTHYVKATDSIPQIIRIIKSLIARKVAYQSGANIYFDVKKFPGYGKLSHFTPKQMKLLLKERGGDPDDPNKRNPLDFILWQGWKEGEPFWKTPWGKGRPGWHIECSAMINQYMGDQIDIHGGGRDLVFPHHESEIAQSESYTRKAPFVGDFMHTAMVMSAGEKMSKSLGNLVLVSNLLKKYSPNAIRWVLLSHHYRQIWEYDKGEFDEAEKYMKKARKSIYSVKPSKSKVDRSAVIEFDNAMDDDLNTPQALQIVKELLRRDDAYTASYIMGILGFVA
jgi:L-cysteine:1D-myo-inositol 2-amino-2-deoxy-alpha-D-glucopyranoside ligase